MTQKSLLFNYPDEVVTMYHMSDNLVLCYCEELGLYFYSDGYDNIMSYGSMVNICFGLDVSASDLYTQKLPRVILERLKVVFPMYEKRPFDVLRKETAVPVTLSEFTKEEMILYCEF